MQAEDDLYATENIKDQKKRAET